MGSKSQISGVLTIISGALGVIGGLFTYLFIPLFNVAIEQDPGSFDFTSYDMSILTGFFIFCGTVGLLLGILAIIGGIFSVKRRVWGMALTGAIAGILTFFPLGIASVILISIGKTEFNQPVITITPVQSQPPVQPPPSPPVPPAV
jgi:hypothetical protein